MIVGQTETVTEYVLHGKNITHLTRGTDELHFYYDAQGNPAVVVFNGTAYGYLYNLQGDVIALVDGSGTKVVEYNYDAWGKPTGKTGTMVGTLGALQPFRYRGYVFDEETGDYYLRSRYYRAEWGRFLSADELIQGNLYCYCNNQVTIFADYTGFSKAWIGFEKMGGKKGTFFAENNCAIGAGVAIISIPLLALNAMFQPGKTNTHVYERTTEIPILDSEEYKDETIIYRYYSTRTENLAPRPGIDYDGLSFSTRPPTKKMQFTVTTIEAINRTGLMNALPPKNGHVLIQPIGGDVHEWMGLGMSSIWSQALSIIVEEYGE